jgi:type VI secretion system protein ImpG
MSAGDQDLLGYFQQELEYLRDRGAAFAERYPKVAGRLEMGGEQSPDPHVERLIESFAFLTARLQRDIDDEFPEITQALLGILYPQLVDPVPSMTIAHMQVDPDRIKLTSGYSVPKGTALFAEAEEGAVCWFRTCYRTTLFPFAVRRAYLATPDQLDYGVRPDTAAVLGLDLASLGEPLAAYRADPLRFFLKADPVQVAALYQLLVCRVAWVGLRRPGQDSVTLLPQARVEPAGFALDEDVLPYPAHAQPAYRLLQEYAEFPDKFYFLDLKGLDFAGCEQAAELVIGLDASPPRQLSVGAENFLLGCTPVVNLFRKLSEPIRLTERVTSYWLIPDLRRRRITETHSILSVSASADPDDEAAVVSPFYSFDHAHATRQPSLYWLARRRPTGRACWPHLQPPHCARMTRCSVSPLTTP